MLILVDTFQFIAQIIKLIEKIFYFFENLKNKIPNKQKNSGFGIPEFFRCKSILSFEWALIILQEQIPLLLQVLVL